VTALGVFVMVADKNFDGFVTVTYSKSEMKYLGNVDDADIPVRVL